MFSLTMNLENNNNDQNVIEQPQNKNHIETNEVLSHIFGNDDSENQGNGCSDDSMGGSSSSDQDEPNRATKFGSILFGFQFCFFLSSSFLKQFRKTKNIQKKEIKIR